MPRIQPLQLLECLEVLLTPSGGIKGDEVERISSLMEKYSKMMVSKAVYLLILKETESSLLDSFMEYGGWNLIRNWLSYALNDFNWPLLKEILEVLAISPVNVDRLKSNELPRLIKFLSKGSDVPLDVRDLATNIVQNWLAFVKAATKTEENNTQVFLSTSDNKTGNNVTTTESTDNVDEDSNSDDHVSSESKLKRNKKVVVSDNSDDSDEDNVNVTNKAVRPIKEVKTERKTRSRKILNKLGSSKTSNKLPPKELNTDNNIRLKINRTDKVNLSLKRKSNLSENDVPKMKSSVTDEKNTSDKILFKLQKLDAVSGKKLKASTFKVIKEDASKLKNESKNDNKKLMLNLNKSSDSNEVKVSDKINKKITDSIDRKNSEKEDNLKSKIDDKGTDKSLNIHLKTLNENTSKVKDKLIARSLEIKKPNEFSDDVNRLKNDEKINTKKANVPKKPVSISIEKRFLSSEEKPKTVKTYNSKFRLTGLEDAVTGPPKPPVKRPVPLLEKKKVIPELFDKKKIPTPLSPSISTSPSVTSPPVLSVSNIEDNNEKGESTYAKGLCPVTKSKKILQDCGSFIDAMISAAQVPKDQTRKRKKLQKDNSVEENSRDKSNDSESPSSVTPKLRFYKDTLESSSSDEDKKVIGRESNQTENMNIAFNEPGQSTGILKVGSRLHGRSYSKKTVCWKDDKELESVQYFEVDASERSNVSRTFCDMSMRERFDEREALFRARKQIDDYSSWLTLIPIDLEPTNRIPGSGSVDKELQYLREKSVSEVIYFNKDMIPDSPKEPDPEMYTHTDPVIIPAEDVADTVCDFGDFQWPEPKMNDPDSETTPTNQGTTTGNVSTIYNQFLGNTATFPQNAALATMPFGPNTAPVANVALPPNFPTVSLPAIGLPSEIVPMFNTMPTIPITNMPPHMMNLPNSNLPAQFAHPTFVGTNVFVPNMTAAPPTPAMQPAGSQNQNWGQVQASSNANNDQSKNVGKSVHGKDWNSNSESKNNSSDNYLGYSNGPSWGHGDNGQHNRRGRGGFQDKGRFNSRGMYNRVPDRGGHKNVIDHLSSRADHDHRLNERPYSREQNWKTSGTNWRGPTPSNTRLCRNIKQKGFCAVNGCRFFHPGN